MTTALPLQNTDEPRVWGKSKLSPGIGTLGLQIRTNAQYYPLLLFIAVVLKETCFVGVCTRPTYSEELALESV